MFRFGTVMELINVRTPVERREIYVTGTQNVALDRLDVAA